MSLTTKDIQTIKALLKEQIQTSEENIKKKIDTLDTNIRSLQKNMEKGFDNISVEMVKFAGVLHQDHEKRIIALEHKINHAN